MHLLALNTQERKKDRTEEGACLCGKEEKRARNGKRFSSSARHLADLLPCPCSCILGLGCYYEFKDSEVFKVEKNKASSAGQRKEGNHSEPLGKGQDKQKVMAPTCLPPCLSLHIVAMEQTEGSTVLQLGSSWCPGSIAQDRLGNLTQHSSHCCCSFPFSILLYPLQQSHAHWWCREDEIPACLVKMGFTAPQGLHHCSNPAVSFLDALSKATSRVSGMGRLL